MAIRLISTVALISVLLVNACFAYRTITTTVEIDDDEAVNPGRKEGEWSPSEQCWPEIQGKDMHSCMLYITGSSSRGSRDMVGRENQQGDERGSLQECCNVVKQVSDDCQCEAIQALVHDELERGRETEKEEQQTAIQKASQIPSSCGLRRQCRIQTVSFLF